LAAVVRSVGKALYWVANALVRLLFLGVLLVVICCGLIWALISWPFRWRPKPFDSTIWSSKEARQNGDRYRMVDDLVRKIRGKSREEVITLLGEPDRPCPRRYPDDPERSCDLAYYLCPSRPIGRWELFIRLDEQAKVKAANATYSD
jgi:hypothetical protein